MKDDSECESKQLNMKNTQQLKKIFVDTNILLNPKFNLSDYQKVYISIVSIEELDGLKNNEKVSYQARKAIKNIKSSDNVKVITNTNLSVNRMFLEHGNDNIILSMAFDVYCDDEEVIFISDDYNLIVKAQAFNIPCEMFEFEDNDKKDVYNGIRKLILTEQEYVDLLENPNDFSYDFQPNEYIIIHNTTSNDEYLFTWNKYFEEVKIKPLSNKYVNKITPLDIYQKAFIHMLQNDNIKVKITDSRYGSGKSYLMIHWALHMLDKEKVDKLYFVKSDSPPKNRREFPAIPGGISEKTEPLMGVLCDSTGETSLTDILLRNNRLEILPIQFAKGRSLKNSILYINEAQDFTPSEMERLLSRIGEGTFALLDGSTSQIDNRYCLNRNGLSVTINNFKNKYIAGQVNMIEDYRSEISKMISDMDWMD